MGNINTGKAYAKKKETATFDCLFFSVNENMLIASLIDP